MCGMGYHSAVVTLLSDGNLIYMLQVAHWPAGSPVCLVMGCLPVQVFINLQLHIGCELA